MRSNLSYPRYKATLLLLFCCAVILGLSSCRASSGGGETSAPTEATAAEPEGQIIQTSVPSADNIDGYGDLVLELTSKEMKELGFDYADVVAVKFLDQELLVPVVPEYRYVSAKSPAIVMWKNSEKLVELEVLNGSFVSDYGIAKQEVAADGSKVYSVIDGVSFPLSVTIEMREKGGYADAYALYDIQCSNNREDYTDLSDEEFCNFRMVTTSGIGKDRLYRSSSPITPYGERYLYADAACAAHGIKSIVDLADTEEIALAYDGYEDTYYSKQKILFLDMNTDFQSDVSRATVVDVMEFIAEAETPILIHCVWGQDRTAYVCALLECLMGASHQEITQDYMLTFYNLYGVKPGTEQYDRVSKNLDKHLSTSFKVDDLSACDLKKEAEEYFRELGVSEETVEAVRKKIGV